MHVGWANGSVSERAASSGRIIAAHGNRLQLQLLAKSKDTAPEEVSEHAWTLIIVC